MKACRVKAIRSRAYVKNCKQDWVLYETEHMWTLKLKNYTEHGICQNLQLEAYTKYGTYEVSSWSLYEVGY